MLANAIVNVVQLLKKVHSVVVLIGRNVPSSVLSCGRPMQWEVLFPCYLACQSVPLLSPVLCVSSTRQASVLSRSTESIDCLTMDRAMVDSIASIVHAHVFGSTL